VTSLLLGYYVGVDMNGRVGSGHSVPRSAAVLVVDDDPMVNGLMTESLREAGFDVVSAASGHEALERLAEAIPDVIVSDVMMPGLSGFELIGRIRAQSALRGVPLLFVTTRSAQEDIVHGLGLGADDYLVKPFGLPEFVARVRSKVDRPSVAAELLPVDRASGALTLEAFGRVVERERSRADVQAAVAHIRVPELARVRDRLGVRAEREAIRQVTNVLQSSLGPTDVVAREPDGGWLLFLTVGVDDVDLALAETARRVNDVDVVIGGTSLRLTPVVGYEVVSHQLDSDTLIERARLASEAASIHLDLLPIRFDTGLAEAMHDRAKQARGTFASRWWSRVRTPFQILLTLFIGGVVPYLLYWGADSVGFDLASVMYLVVVVALLFTGVLIWAEGLAALKQTAPPDVPDGEAPTMSAIIAAYLPNEAATIVGTIEAFLAVDYPGRTQIILAYNGPDRHPVESTFATIARTDPRFVPLRVDDSTSKAQNVNAALAHVEGEFVGVFDADHHPDPTSFTRAWQWLASDADIVQGHPVVRNGDASWIARTVAVEFEAIYAVSHPGRARLHDFGIFGGSNGFWRTSLLRSIRMNGRMLTEDIDSSLRVVQEGGRIVPDPGLVSRELATTTIRQLWNQRMRWAQGWFQVSMVHTRRAMRNPLLSTRQKLGFLHLLLWREIYPWLSLQMFPIIIYWTVGVGERLDWFVPVLVLTTVFTLSVGPGQTYFAYRLAAPEIRERKRWFLVYFFVSSFLYTEFKNVIARVAQVKEFMGDRQWKVTPRPVSAEDGVQ
jgi:DNA-binding response OmpR family regulator/cellulose synthase/poly-beta-1,6-N-acetylglucosamine synthase-like glycosyltransferase